MLPLDELKGKAKESYGKLTGDKKAQSEGKTDQVKGKVKEAGNDVKDAVKGVKDSLSDEK